MKILAVDTATNMLTAALWEDGVCLGEISLNHKRAHSQRLMPTLQQLFTETELAPEEVDLLAASNGPGSFTGLRIGLACVKGLAQALQKPVAAVNTLEGLAYTAAGDEREIWPLLDGGRGRLYGACYRWNGERMECRTAPFATTVEEIGSFLGDEALLTGDGGRMYAERLGKPCLPGRLCLPMASSVAAAAQFAPRLKPEELTALYISKPQAQRELEERMQQKS